MTKKRNTRAANGVLRAGVGFSDITATGTDERTRDRLYVKALVLDDGLTRLAIVSLDTTAIGGRFISDGALNDVGEEFLPQLRQRAEKELHIPGVNLLVNASHTHPPGRLLCSDSEQVKRSLNALKQAVQNLTEARIGVGSGSEKRITINRTLRLKNGRDWTIRHSNPCPPDDEVEELGPIDPEIGVLRVDRLDGSPIAVVYNFACHLLFGDAEGRITANIPGVASRTIAENVGDGAVAIFLQGAGGNVIDHQFKDFNRPRDIEPLGIMLGLSTLDAWRRIETENLQLNMLSATIQLPLRTDIPCRITQLHQEQNELLEQLRSSSLNFEAFLPLYLRYKINPDFPLDYSYKYLQAEALGSTQFKALDAWNKKQIEKYLRNIRTMERLTVIQDDIATLKKHQKVIKLLADKKIAAEIQAIRIGNECVMITSPAELLVEIGLNLKKLSPFKHTLVVPFSNGYLHYGAPAEAYSRGGYEVTECLLAPEWQHLYEDKASEMMQELKRM